ncbi:MAG TPA: hypothetical protein DCL61_10845, partial [Cyanobacteria bacterium UBA12227]|nr:hypothetical protein [Cyanobacteria bacterium UBA12227]
WGDGERGRGREGERERGEKVTCLNATWYNAEILHQSQQSPLVKTEWRVFANATRFELTLSKLKD